MEKRCFGKTRTGFPVAAVVEGICRAEGEMGWWGHLNHHCRGHCCYGLGSCLKARLYWEDEFAR